MNFYFAKHEQMVALLESLRKVHLEFYRLYQVLHMEIMYFHLEIMEFSFEKSRLALLC